MVSRTAQRPRWGRGGHRRRRRRGRAEVGGCKVGRSLEAHSVQKNRARRGVLHLGLQQYVAAPARRGKLDKRQRQTSSGYSARTTQAWPVTLAQVAAHMPNRHTHRHKYRHRHRRTDIRVCVPLDAVHFGLDRQRVVDLSTDTRGTHTHTNTHTHAHTHTRTHTHRQTDRQTDMWVRARTVTAAHCAGVTDAAHGSVCRGSVCLCLCP
jgi:hypothetical protein